MKAEISHLAAFLCPALPHNSHAAEAQKPLQEQRAAAESRIQAAEIQARSLVSAEVQARAEEQRVEAQEQLQKAKEEVAEMRLKLADSWVTDTDRVADSEDMQALEEVEKSLQWLANTQHAASTQTQLVERLERKKGSLQQRLREVSEEKAALQSTRVDLGDAGKAMRETMASQSEGYVKQLVGLEEARRAADSDRIKLMQDFTKGWDITELTFSSLPPSPSCQVV